jgi:hypothetical protein
MSTITVPNWSGHEAPASGNRRETGNRAAGRFALFTLTIACAACLLAGWAPLGFSIVTVFLFAGPHNWMEGRYMLGRMPARWGPLGTYYLTGIAGVLGLTIAFAGIPLVATAWHWDHEAWLAALASWNTVLVLWIAALVGMRSRQNPRRDWAWLTPVGLALVAAAWLWPRMWDLGLVYLHPLIALWFLDRELGVNRPQWRRAYRYVLAMIPVLLAALWWRLAGAPPLPGDDALSARITAHAGGELLIGISNHLLVATHTFLEMLHYGVWLVAIPLVSLRTAPWRIGAVPLARRSRSFRVLIGALLAVGLLCVLGFWAGFVADYPLTRDVYFTVAMLHVLAEAPFLLRLL